MINDSSEEFEETTKLFGWLRMMICFTRAQKTLEPFVEQMSTGGNSDTLEAAEQGGMMERDGPKPRFF